MPDPEAPEKERLPSAPVAVAERTQLDELMLAMDVVDTLRHRELVLARELGEEDRERELTRRLREIYTSQGIEVSDDILTQGVRALVEDRFVYPPPHPSFARTLARVYVSRGKWGKPVAALVGLLAAALLGYQLFVRGPELRAATELPAQIEAVQQSISGFTNDPGALTSAAALASAGEAAVARHDYDAARESVTALRDLEAQLAQQYELRIVSRPGERSGFFRVPSGNSAARNYYLVVEAVAPNGRTLTLPIKNEEDGKTYRVSKWGIRVDEDTYRAVERDKRDDGIIEQALVGRKARGALEPEYAIPTTGAAVTRW